MELNSHVNLPKYAGRPIKPCFLLWMQDLEERNGSLDLILTRLMGAITENHLH